MNKPTINISIAAYNAERNIERLINSLLRQKLSNCKLNKIIVYSDNSTDNTVSRVKKLGSKNVKIIDSKKRQGFGAVIKELIKKNCEDILILLNDDIIIEDNKFISKCIKPLFSDSMIGFICANPIPQDPSNFVQKAVITGYRPYKKLGLDIRHGENVFTVDGKAMVLSKQFIKKMEFPKELSDMANVDAYLYFECLRTMFRYHFAEDAKLYFRTPSTISDFIKWQARNNSNKYILQDRFGIIVEKEYSIPKLHFSLCRFSELIRNPLSSTFIYILGFISRIKTNATVSSFSPLWETIETTKKI